MSEQSTPSYPSWSIIVFTASLIWALSLFVPLLLQEAFGQSLARSSPDEIRQSGQRMYREGVLPSGKAMQSVVRDDVAPQGTSFSCASCHMRSGLGSSEGEVIAEPVNGKSLFNPRKPPKGISSSMSGGMSKNTDQPRQAPSQPRPGRPAYTDETLAKALRQGIDPSGRVLDPYMPRYLLQDQDMAVMIAYLKTLSSNYSSGVDDQNLRFATVISEDVPAGLRDEQAILLENLISRMNEQARDYDKRLQDPKKNRHMNKTWRMQYRNLTLSRWLLKGAPETWPAQLENYYRKEPVFALLGGIAAGDWKPINDFCESNRIPCIFPQTDFPVVADANEYTFYFSKGLYQEGEAVARFINSGTNDPADSSPVVQVVRNSRQGRALSAGFESAWHDLGQSPPTTVRLQPGESIAHEALEKLFAREQPVTLLVWDGAEALPLLTAVAGMKNRPEAIYISSSYFGKKATALPEQMRDITYLTYPYRLPREEAQLEEYYLGATIKNRSDQDDANRIRKLTYPLTRILIDALAEMKENFYRDYFLDIISNHNDLDVPLYERLSFGPGQRYAAKGCYIVQLSSGANPELVKKSLWITH